MLDVTEDRVLGVLPYAMLALAALVAVASAPALGDASADAGPLLAVTAATYAWMLLTPRGSALHWVGRASLAFALCWMNPFFAIFAFVGLLDVYDVFPSPYRWLGLVFVAVTMAGSQSGGFPPTERTQAVVFAALVVVNGGLTVVFGTLGRRAEERNAELERLNAELQRALAQNLALHEKVVAQARRAGVTEERQRLAAEIHDTLAQSLAGIVTQLEAAVTGERHARALDLARSALSEARRSVLDLAPSDLDGASLPDALGAVVRGWAHDRSVRADVVVTGEVEALHPEVEATVIRVVQEALTNVARHAAATRAQVTLAYDDEEVVVDVRDDGRGFDPGADPGAGSFGMRSMRQRAERLAGTLTVESGPGAGTAVSLRLPALAREAA